MHTFRKLRSPEDLEAFKAGYEAQVARRSGGRITSKVALEYLAAASRVVGCFDRAGRMVAGYVVQRGQPLIIPLAMPPAHRARFLATVEPGELAELTAIWRDDGISANRFAALVWPRIILDCVVGGRRVILGIGYDNPMNAIYDRVGPRLVYRGPHQVYDGLEVWIYAYSRPVLVATFAVNLVARKLLPLLRRGAG